MFGLMFPQYKAVLDWWARAVAGLAWNQWRALDAQYAAGIDLFGAAAGEGGTATRPRSLEQEAVERVGKGLAPPREVYEAQNRGRIDWSRFPDWARPIDPEVFEGSSHEG
jgi:hypothetical protein